MASERGTIKEGDVHPMAVYALGYIIDLGPEVLFRWLGALSSCAIEGNELADICGETLRRIIYKERVSDRYVLGLAWYLRSQIKDDNTVESWDNFYRS